MTEPDLLFQVHRVLQNCLKDGKVHGPIICHQVFTAAVPIPGRIQKFIIRKLLQARDWVFKDETGIPSQPPYNIMPKIIPNLVWDKSLPFPLNNTWGYHDAATGNGRYDLYYKEMVKRYGEPVRYGRLQQ